MRGFLLTLVLIPALPSWGADAAAAGPATRPALPPGTWVRLAGPSWDVPQGILAYSGMAVDGKGGRVLLFGGGHADYWGNEVWAWDIPTRAWRRLTEPTPRGRYATTRFDWDDKPGMFPNLGLPVSRHTYDSVEFVDHLGLMFAAGSSTFSGNEREKLWDRYPAATTGPFKDKGWGSFDVWLFDPAKAAWHYRRPAAEMGDGGNLCAYAPDAGVLVVMRSGSWGGFRGPMLYDPAKDRWEPTAAMKAKVKPNTGIHQTAAYDTRRRRVYLVGGSTQSDALWAYDLARDAWLPITPAAGELPDLKDAAGSAYCPDADALVTFGPAGTWVYHPGPNRWQPVGPAPTARARSKFTAGSSTTPSAASC